MRELGTFEIDPHRNRKVKDMLPDEQPRERLPRAGLFDGLRSREAAEHLGVSSATLSRRLRKEVSHGA